MKQALVALSQREEDILQAVNTYRMLTTTQVCRLFFSEHSYNYAGKLLKHLADTDYLIRFPLPSAEKGNRELVYTLGRPGIQFLKSIGYDLPYWSKNALLPPSYLHMQHSLSVNNVLIAGFILAKQVPGITLHALYHEWVLKHTPLAVSLGNSEVGVVPDGFLDFRLLIRETTYQTGVWIEVDRGTEDQPYVRRKVRALQTVLAQEMYKDYLQTSSMVVAFATTAGAPRLKALRCWIEEELKTLHATESNEFFLLTSLPPEIDPRTLFLRPVWSMPFVSQLQPLLDLS
jgi:hypothetical protein